MAPKPNNVLEDDDVDADDKSDAGTSLDKSEGEDDKIAMRTSPVQGGSGDASHATIECDICKFIFTAWLLINIGCRKYPKWRCRPCHTASKFYDKVLISKNVVPGDMKKLERGRYCKFVFRLRVCIDDDPEEVRNLLTASSGQIELTSVQFFLKLPALRRAQFLPTMSATVLSDSGLAIMFFGFCTPRPKRKRCGWMQ